MLFNGIDMRNQKHLCTSTFIRQDKAETAVTHMIFFIAAVVIAMGVIAVMSVNIQSVTGATSTGSKVLSEQLKTDITVITDPEMVPNNGNNYTFYAKNTGKSNLVPEYVDVLLDGSIVMPDDLNLAVLDGNDLVWRPGDVLVINVTTSSGLGSGDHRLQVSVENGVSDSISFKI